MAVNATSPEYAKEVYDRRLTKIERLAKDWQDASKRARRAEEERDAFDKRIAELEAERHEIIRACLGRDVKDALASQVLGLWKSQSALIDRVVELEKERDGLNRETEAKATVIANLVARCEELEV